MVNRRLAKVVRGHKTGLQKTDAFNMRDTILRAGYCRRATIAYLTSATAEACSPRFFRLGFLTREERSMKKKNKKIKI